MRMHIHTYIQERESLSAQVSQSESANSSTITQLETSISNKDKTILDVKNELMKLQKDRQREMDRMHEVRMYVCMYVCMYIRTRLFLMLKMS